MADTGQALAQAVGRGQGERVRGESRAGVGLRPVAERAPSVTVEAPGWCEDGDNPASTSGSILAPLCCL